MTRARRARRLADMTDTLPPWAVTNGQPDAEKIIKHLNMYGYIMDKDGSTFVDKKLADDYPAVYKLLYDYKMSTLAKKYTDMIKEGKFEAYRDDDGKLKYRMDDDIE